ncbi:MAG: S8 family serine peptidase, partial [Chloroflexi bacterium]|nr:S8 family serine peptidase [Chloroflexota bacterium]
MRSKTIRILALIIVLAMIASPVSGLRLNTVEAQGGLPGRSDLVPTGHTPVDKYSAVDAGDVVDKTEVSRYIVLFEGASLSRAKGSAGINSIEGQNYLDSLAVNRQTMLTKAESLLGRSIQVRYIYDVILNGVSVELSAQEAEELQSLPGIRKVLKDQDYTYTTDAGPEWIGAGDIWDGAAVPDTVGTKGEGVLVGILDGGINFDHPSFSDTPDNGFVYSWTGDYLGVCAPAGDPEYADACNDKVVGAWSYTYDAPSDFVTPEDAEGHGSHTASTVAGNFVDVDFYGTEVTISGVAPHAQIIAYDVCYPTPDGGQCAGEDSVAAVQQAILDGVDVINYSISGGENPYSDGVELAFLDATAAGVTVSTSAGNSGPGAATVAHRSPWLLSTAATSHNRK